MPEFDAQSLRNDFPILAREVGGKPLAYLDNGATSQKPRQVIEVVERFYREGNANIHRGVHTLSREATEAYEAARETVKRTLGTPEGHELIFTRGATEAVNLITHGLEPELAPGDEVVLTLMEHHANIVPWQILAERRGAVVRFAEVTEEGALDLEHWRSLFNERTRVAAFTHVSNVLGTVNPVAEMTAFARERGAVTLVDGAQAVPHGEVDLASLGADFYVFSGHKAFAPDGIGVLVGDRARLDRFRPYQSGGDMIERVSVRGSTYRQSPERFEAGTPNISGAIGLAEAFRYLASFDREAAARHESHLAEALAAALREFGGVRLFGETPGKAAIVSFLADWAHPHDLAAILDTEGVAVRDGHHCAQPLMDRYGVPATVRASFAFYNNEEDVAAFLRGMEKAKRFLA